jgi:hypothetical protein
MAKETERVTADDHVAAAADLNLTDKPEYPGQTMGVIALVLSFFLQLPALVLGIVAWVWSNKAGVSNVPAKVAVAVSAVLLVLGTLAVIGWIIVVASTLGGMGFGGFDAMGGPGFRS